MYNSVKAELATDYFEQGFICPWTYFNYGLGITQYEVDRYKPNLVHMVKFTKANWKDLFNGDKYFDLVPAHMWYTVNPIVRLDHSQLSASHSLLKKWWIDENNSTPPMLGEDFVYREGDIISCIDANISTEEYITMVSQPPLTPQQYEAEAKQAAAYMNHKHAVVLQIRQKTDGQRLQEAQTAWKAAAELNERTRNAEQQEADDDQPPEPKRRKGGSAANPIVIEIADNTDSQDPLMMEND
jgi:hypothetical protein